MIRLMNNPFSLVITCLSDSRQGTTVNYISPLPRLRISNNDRVLIVVRRVKCRLRDLGPETHDTRVTRNDELFRVLSGLYVAQR